MRAMEPPQDWLLFYCSPPAQKRLQLTERAVPCNMM